MKTVILAGGRGLRLPQELRDIAKPLIRIGNTPILVHLMNIYSQHKQKDFIICLGYNGYSIKEYFMNFYLHNSNMISFDFENLETIHDVKQKDWKVTLIETGNETNTGGRLLRVKKYIESGTFLMNYGDGLSDVDISNMIEFHKKHGKLATVLAVNVPSKFGSLLSDESCLDGSGLVYKFSEKIKDNSLINGGFFVLNSEVFKYIKDDNTSWEYDCLPALVNDKQLMAYRYDGFWQCMDSLKDKIELEKMWSSGKAPWKVW